MSKRGDKLYFEDIITSIEKIDAYVDFETLPRKWFAFAILSAVFGGMFLLSLTPIFYLFLGVFYAVVIWLFWGK